MGRDAFSPGVSSPDAFSRSAAPAASLHAPAKDRFKEKADKLAARKGARPPGDAFAGAVRPAAGRDAFRVAGDASPRVREAAHIAAPKQRRTLANGVSLKVVASQPQAMRAEPAKQEESNSRRKAAKSSSFVLVSSATVVEASSSATPAVAGDGGQGPLVIPPLSSQKFRPAGGGGGGGRNGGGSGAPPPRDRILNQDDLAGVMIVLAILLLLTLYFLRGNGGGAATDDSVLDIQSASTEPAVAPPAPLADPFGDQAVDLTPKSPPPSELAVVAATPAPAPAAIDVRVHAYFCTDKSELTPASAEALDREIAAWGDRMAGKSLVVEGYADTRGEAVYNTWLGGERAKAVANYLSARGFNATALGVGELADLTDNQNCAHQRRVDVRLADAPSEAPSRSCAPPPELVALACVAEPRPPASSEQAQTQ